MSVDSDSAGASRANELYPGLAIGTLDVGVGPGQVGLKVHNQGFALCFSVQSFGETACLFRDASHGIMGIEKERVNTSVPQMDRLRRLPLPVKGQGPAHFRRKSGADSQLGAVHSRGNGSC